MAFIFLSFLCLAQGRCACPRLNLYMNEGRKPGSRAPLSKLRPKGNRTRGAAVYCLISRCALAIFRRELYASANGDSWYLCREGSGRVFVEHEPNLPSGGKSSRIELTAFLQRPQGPEHQALLHLIGTLVDRDSPIHHSVRTV